MDLSGYSMELLRDEPDAALYRARLTGNPGSLLVLVPTLGHENVTERLERELALAPVLDAIGAVRPLALTRLSGRRVLVLEDPGGTPLQISDDRRSNLAFCLRVAASAAATLAEAHRREFVHRDIRPGNILVDDFGTAWLTGFGFAVRPPLESSAIEEPIVGTLAYIAPEQTGRMDRPVDNRSDLYSLGVTLYEMLAGSPPFTASDAIGLIHSHMARRPPSLRDRSPAVPAQVEAVVFKLMAKTPEDRYRTAESAEKDLRRCLTDLEAGRPIMAFVLGQHDRFKRLQVPERLYGREVELRTLVETVEAVARNGGKAVAWITGVAGVGKSSLLKDVRNHVSLGSGMSVAGKFEQLKRDAPYATIAQSFAPLIGSLLGTPQPELNAWRTRLIDALGTNGQLLTNLIPQLSLIIGEQSPAPDVPSLSRQQRFQAVMRRFIDIFALPGRPLLWILDDLQWSDAATLALIEDLVGHPETQNLVFLGAFRDDEVGSTHPLQEVLTRIRGIDADVREMQLATLSVEDIRKMVAYAFSLPEGNVLQLTDFVFGKTLGNPLFTSQMLTTLAENGLATFDEQQSRWACDADRITYYHPATNVVDLITARISHLPNDTLELLSLHACIGVEAEVDVIALVSGREPSACHYIMREAVRVGLANRNGTSYSFAHDRIQEAVYARIPEDQRSVRHLRIGRALHGFDLALSSTEHVFAVVDQMNRGRSSIDNGTEVKKLADLNRHAARLAKNSAAYDAALTYLGLANQALLASDPTPYITLKFELDLIQAECLFLTGKVDLARDLLVDLESRCMTRLDKAAVVCLAIDVHMFTSDNSRAVDIALRCLELFDIKLPRSPSASDFDEFFNRLWKQFDTRTIESISQLPQFTDDDVEAAMRVLTALFAPAAFQNTTLLHINLCCMVELTLQHGLMEASAAGLGWFGMVLGSVHGRYEEGYRFARVAADLVERREFSANKAKTLLALHHVSAWVRPLSEVVATLRVSFAAAVSIGDLATACFCCANLGVDRLLQCDDLHSVQDEVRVGLRYSISAGMRDIVDFLTVEDRYIKTMRGETAEFSQFDGDEFDTIDFENTLINGRMTHVVCFYWTMKGAAKYVAGLISESLHAFSKALPLIREVSGQMQSLNFHYFHALALAAVVRNRDASDDGLVGQIASHLTLLRAWAATCPSTFSDKAALVSAELARIEGRQLEAMQLYEKAIQFARQHSMVQNEGLGNELAGEFYLGLGLTSCATAHLMSASNCYRSWGAHGKVKQIEDRFPALKQEADVGSFPSPSLSLEQLDRATIVAISQSISSEIDLVKLTERLISIALQHSGGERAVFVHAENDIFWIEAEGSATESEICVTSDRIEVADSSLPMSIIRYVIRSREMVIVSDTARQNQYFNDVYFRTSECRSLICVPLISYTTTIGVIYIESRNLADAFRLGGSGVLDLISSQAAISLENAILYKDREKMITMARQAESELRLTMNIAPVLVWSIYSNGLGGEFNDRWHEYTGISPEIARKGGWLDAFHPDDRSKVSSQWSNLVQTGTAGEVEARLLRKDGTSRSFLVRATPLRNEDGSVVKWYGTHIDIEDIRRIEQTQEALARGSRLTTIGELTVSIAHEVNQPLMAMVTNAAACLRWLHEDRINIPEARKAAERINADGHRAGAIIAGIRSLAKKSQPVVAIFNLEEAICEVLALMRGELQRTSIAVKTEFEESAALALGDRVQIQQVVLNLLMNSIEAMNMAGDVNRIVRIETREVQDEFIQVCVSDEGSGLDPSSVNRIFDAFFTTKPDGLGIGLSICRSIIESHQGRLWAVPGHTCGSEFRFTIPLSRRTYSPDH